MKLGGLDGRASSRFDRVATPWTNDAMWTPATRRQHSRAGLRYASDLTDGEWRTPLYARLHKLGPVREAGRQLIEHTSIQLKSVQSASALKRAKSQVLFQF